MMPIRFPPIFNLAGLSPSIRHEPKEELSSNRENANALSCVSPSMLRFAVELRTDSELGIWRKDSRSGALGRIHALCGLP